jgi:transposase-like protein
METGEKTELDYLAEIARWTREAALPTVRSRVERLLDTDAKKRVYEAMESGTFGVKSIEKLTGVNSGNISPWAKQWEAEGIIDRASSPPKATFSLSELGISPAPPKTERPRAKGAK